MQRRAATPGLAPAIRGWRRIGRVRGRKRNTEREGAPFRFVHERSMAHSIVIQGRVIHALILRETKTLYGHTKAGFLWALAEPALALGSFWFAYALAGKGDTLHMGLSLPIFLLTGILPYQMFYCVTIKCMNAIDGNKALLTYPQVTPLDIVIARALLEGAVLCLVFILFLVVFSVFGFDVNIDSTGRVILGLSLSWILGISFGLVLASLTIYTHALEKIIMGGLRILHFLSGVFFSTDMLPPQVRPVLLVNPMLHAVELTRGGFAAPLNHEYLSPLYALSWGLGLLLLGMLLERKVRGEIENI